MTIQDIFISNAVETFAFLSKRVFEEKNSWISIIDEKLNRTKLKLRLMLQIGNPHNGQCP